ncbi:MAG: hypothetical protein U1E76_16420 [Planctomycetota bacterium]
MSRGVKLAVWLAALAALAAVGQILTAPLSTRCAMDGRRIEWIYAVTARFPDGTVKVFCSVRCAASCLAADERTASVEVRDQISGEPVSAERAYFVRGRGPAGAPSGGPPYDGVHVFRDWVKALAQQEALGGELIRNPFKR